MLYAHILPLFVGVKIRFALVAIVSDLIVHSITDIRRNQSLVVLKRLARPHDKHIVLGNLASVGRKIFLNKLSKSGSECIHEGDADLDGFRIAEEVGKCIRLKKVVASDVLKKASLDAGRELTSEQMKRTSAFLFNPKYRDYEFADEIQSILKRGRWIEQESFTGVLKGREVKGGEK